MADYKELRPRSIFGLIAAMLQVKRELQENRDKPEEETASPPPPRDTEKAD